MPLPFSQPQYLVTALTLCNRETYSSYVGGIWPGWFDGLTPLYCFNIAQSSAPVVSQIVSINATNVQTLGFIARNNFTGAVALYKTNTSIPYSYYYAGGTPPANSTLLGYFSTVAAGSQTTLLSCWDGTRHFPSVSQTECQARGKE